MRKRKKKKTRKRRVSDDKWSEIRALYIYGESIDDKIVYPSHQQLSDRFGIPKGTIDSKAADEKWGLRRSAAKTEANAILAEEARHDQGIENLVDVQRQTLKIYDSVIASGLRQIKDKGLEATIREMLTAAKAREDLYSRMLDPEGQGANVNIHVDNVTVQKMNNLSKEDQEDYLAAFAKLRRIRNKADNSSDETED